MNDEKTTNELVKRINESLHTIRKGGKLKPQCVFQLIYYIADMMEV